MRIEYFRPTTPRTLASHLTILHSLTIHFHQRRKTRWLHVYTLKASRSIMWLTPRSSSSSYRDPASTYTPTPEKGPGRASVATRIPFGRMVIWSNSLGSFNHLAGSPGECFAAEIATFCAVSTAVASRLVNVCDVACADFLTLGTLRTSARHDEGFISKRRPGKPCHEMEIVRMSLK